MVNGNRPTNNKARRREWSRVKPIKGFRRTRAKRRNIEIEEMMVALLELGIN